MVLGLEELQCRAMLSHHEACGKRGLGCSSVAECFSSVHRTLGTNPSTASIKRAELGSVVHAVTQHSGGRGEIIAVILKPSWATE